MDIIIWLLHNFREFPILVFFIYWLLEREKHLGCLSWMLQEIILFFEGSIDTHGHPRGHTQPQQSLHKSHELIVPILGAYMSYTWHTRNLFLPRGHPSSTYIWVDVIDVLSPILECQILTIDSELESCFSCCSLNALA